MFHHQMALCAHGLTLEIRVSWWGRRGCVVRVNYRDVPCAMCPPPPPLHGQRKPERHLFHVGSRSRGARESCEERRATGRTLCRSLASGLAGWAENRDTSVTSRGRRVFLRRTARGSIFSIAGGETTRKQTPTSYSRRLEKTTTLDI